MNDRMNDDFTVLRDSMRELRRQKAEVAREWDQARALPPRWLDELRELGLLGMQVPEEQGGAGLSTPAAMVVFEELARFSPASAFVVGVHNLLALRLAPDTSAVSQGWVGFADGTQGAVSARRCGHGWVLTGEARPTFLVETASAWVVVAELDGEPAAWLVREGVTPRRNRTLGLRGADIGAMGFSAASGVRVEGGAVWVRAIEDWTLALGSMAFGIGQAALREGLAYGQDRQQFGQPIAGFQAIQWKLANLATALEAARLMLGAAAAWTGEGRAAAIARAVLATVQPVASGCSDMLQVHGGYGYTESFAVERAYRDAQALALHAGVAKRTRMVAAHGVRQRFARY